MYNITNIIYYVIFFFVGINKSITTGLYYYDIVIIISLIFMFLKNKVKISNAERIFFRLIVLFLFLPSIVSISYQVFFYDMNNKYLIYIPYNLILLMVYILFVSNTIKKININYNILILFLFIPVLLAIAMAVSPQINSLIMNLYHIERQHYFRMGGIWGIDVNQLGFYSTIVILFSFFLKKYDKVKNYIFYTVIVLSFVSLILSGMRTGLIMLILVLPVLAIFFKKTSWVSIWNILKYLLIGGVLLGLLFFIFPSFFDLFMGVFERFNIQDLENDIEGSGHTGQGHMGTMYKKWLSTFFNNDNPLDVIFSFYPEWKYPDALVLFFLANNGLFGMFFLFGFIASIIKKMLQTKRYDFFLFFFFSMIISIKGNFILNNFYMFMSVIIIYLGSKFGSERRLTYKCKC